MKAPGEPLTGSGFAEPARFPGRTATAVDYSGSAPSPQGVSPEGTALLLAAKANALLSTDVENEAAALTVAAVGGGGDGGADAAVCSSLFALSRLARVRGDTGESGRLVDAAIRVAAAGSLGARRRHPQFWQASTLLALDQVEAARQSLVVGQSGGATLGSAWCLAQWPVLRAEVYFAEGRLDEASAEAEASLAAADGVDSWVMAPEALALMARVAVLEDNLARAKEVVDRGRTMLDAGAGFVPGDPLRIAAAVLEDAFGHSDRAVAMLGELYPALSDQVAPLVRNVVIAPILVRLALGAGSKEMAVTASGAAQRLAALNPTVSFVQAEAAHCRALLDADPDGLLVAVDRYRTDGRPIGTASASEDAAVELARRGHSLQAVALLDDAVRIYKGAGAKRSVKRASARLRSLGVRRGVRGTTVRATAGWGSLTAAEHRIITLVAQGLTNKDVARELYLSPYTVDAHLRHAFLKLDVSSRVELTGVVLSHEQSALHTLPRE